jgi:transcriptional/translational regulatory protein YebC/TACO1
MMIEFYGKQGVGIVLRATVSNTTKALTSKTGAFTKAKTSFSF